MSQDSNASSASAVPVVCFCFVFANAKYKDNTLDYRERLPVSPAASQLKDRWWKCGAMEALLDYEWYWNLQVNGWSCRLLSEQGHPDSERQTLYALSQTRVLAPYSLFCVFNLEYMQKGTNRKGPFGGRVHYRCGLEDEETRGQRKCWLKWRVYIKKEAHGKTLLRSHC